jgi:hypothetical protein
MISFMISVVPPKIQSALAVGNGFAAVLRPRTSSSDAAIGTSQSGLYAHSGSKQELQLATGQEAGGIFAAEVVQPVPARPRRRPPRSRPGFADLLRGSAVAIAQHEQLRVVQCYFNGTRPRMRMSRAP